MIVALSIGLLAAAAVAVMGWLRASTHRRQAAVMLQQARTAAESHAAVEVDLQVRLEAQHRLAEQLTASNEQAAQALAEATEAARLSDDQANEARRRLAEMSHLADPMVLWALERSRSERTWRHSVASSPDQPYAPIGSGPLTDALHVEVEAAREEVGTSVELAVDVPDDLTAAGCVLILRVAQELLASVVHRAEMCVLHVHCDGRDAIVRVTGEDEHGAAVVSELLPLPASPSVMPDDDGYRITGVRLG